MQTRGIVLALAIAQAIALAPSAASAATFLDPAKLDPAKAEQRLGKGGSEVKAIYAPAGGQFGILYGGRGVGYLTPSVYMGGGGGGGILVGPTGAVGGVGYGGMIMGLETQVAGPLAIGFDLLVGGGGGGGGGTATGSAGVNGGVALEPALALVYNAGSNVRATLSAGYLFMPMSPTLSSITAGVRIDFKNLTLTYPYEE